MKNILSTLLTLILFISCNNTSQKEKELLKKENDLLKKELELSKQEKEEKPVKQINPLKEAKKLFDRYAPKIEKSNDAKIGSSLFFEGDLNDDGLKDVVAFFVLTPPYGGNMIVGSQMAVYLNKKDKMEVVAGYDPKKRFSVVEIENNKVHIIKYEFAEGDFPNKPSIEKHAYLILNGNTLTESRVYN